MREMDGTRKKNLGFTLVEVILTMAILGLVFVPMMGYFANSMKYSTWSRAKQNAIMLAQSRLEDIKGSTSLEKIYNSYKKREENQEEGCYSRKEESMQEDGMGGQVRKITYLLEEKVKKGSRNYLVKIVAEPDCSFQDDMNYSNAVVKPIKEATTAKAMETKEDRMKASSYFMAQNISAYHNLSEQEKNPSLLETDLNQYERHLKKEIFMNLTRDENYDFIEIDCQYWLNKDVFGVNKLERYKCELTKKRFAKGELKQVYLFYQGDIAEDTFFVTSDIEIPVIKDMYFICQNKESLSSGYSFEVNHPIQTFSENIYSNVKTNLVHYKNYLVDVEENIPRKANIKVEVYPYESPSEEEKYIELTGMKGM